MNFLLINFLNIHFLFHFRSLYNLNPSFLATYVSINSFLIGECPTDEADYHQIGGPCYFFVRQYWLWCCSKSLHSKISRWKVVWVKQIFPWWFKLESTNASVSTVMCTLSAKCCLGLKTRVIIKILTNPSYPINDDWFLWGWSKEKNPYGWLNSTNLQYFFEKKIRDWSLGR